jgi:putative oxidoreductase
MFLLNSLAEHRYERWSPLPLRLMVGFGFMEYGFAKLSKEPDVFAAILLAIGVPAHHLMASLTILIEFGGGFAVIVGGLVPLVACRWPWFSWLMR